MNAGAGKCKCGCGAIPERGDYISGHDLKHRSQLVDRAGGVDKLAGLLNQVDAYMLGEIGESELAKRIRQLRAR